MGNISTLISPLYTEVRCSILVPYWNPPNPFETPAFCSHTLARIVLGVHTGKGDVVIFRSRYVFLPWCSLSCSAIRYTTVLMNSSVLCVAYYDGGWKVDRHGAIYNHICGLRSMPGLLVISVSCQYRPSRQMTDTVVRPPMWPVTEDVPDARVLLCVVTNLPVPLNVACLCAVV